jgi:hypothetical protein
VRRDDFVKIARVVIQRELVASKALGVSSRCLYFSHGPYARASTETELVARLRRDPERAVSFRQDRRFALVRRETEGNTRGAVRRVAFGGLVLVGAAVAVGLVMWLAILGLDHASPSGAATVTKPVVSHTAAVPRHAATVAVTSGTACFVAGQECSEIPCTEMIRSTISVAGATAATLVAPSVRGPRLATPVSGCGTRRSLPHATAVTRPGPTQGRAPYSALLANMAHRLAAHLPTQP